MPNTISYLNIAGNIGDAAQSDGAVALNSALSLRFYCDQRVTSIKNLWYMVRMPAIHDYMKTMKLIAKSSSFYIQKPQKGCW
ncbi:hypothetical protein RYX41_15030 [Lactiplantibacillus plantarum]|nr:hypothetical protein [Lactiplantibacillus plantarum]